MEKTFDINIGTEVWVIHRNRIMQGPVTRIWYTKFVSPVDYESVVESEWYTVCDAEGNRIDSFRRKELFKTKEELLKSL